MVKKYPSAAPRSWRLVFACLLAAPLAAFAAVPVEESTAGGRAPATAGAGNTTRLSELYYQLQTLQQEVRELRGLAEEQAHTIARLRKDQKAQYLDLDRRMQGLSAKAGSSASKRPSSGNASLAGQPAGGGSAGSPSLRDGELYVPTAGSTPGAGNATVAGSSAADNQERAAYSGAIELMRARKFDESIRAFNKLVVDFPGGEYNGNAFYWLGELYLAQGNEAKARQQFVQVIDLYPKHNKVPDALYKIAVVYHRQGDKDRALEFLNRVRGEHAGTNAAQLAADYAKEMQ